MGQDTASSCVSVFYPVLLVLLVWRPQLCPPGCAQTREQKKEKSRCQVKLSLLWKWGLAGKPCWVFLISCAQTASMEGTFSAKTLLGHARPDSLRPCYLTRVHPVSQCLALHQDLGPEAGGSSPSLSMVVFYLRLINYYCWTILYFPKINLFISYWNLSCEADYSSLIELCPDSYSFITCVVMEEASLWFFGAGLLFLPLNSELKFTSQHKGSQKDLAEWSSWCLSPPLFNV